MARKRDYAAEYAHRVAGTAAGSEERQRARGHRAGADLLRRIRPGDLVGLDPVLSERDARGRWTRVVISVLGADGVERDYWLSGKHLRAESIERLLRTIDERGAIQAPIYPVDVLLPELDAEAAA